MADLLHRLALASQRAPGQRTFELLGERDLPRLEAFFLCFDFDQRRAHFGGGMSDASVLGYCRAIDWDATTIVARSGPYCLEAVGLLVTRPDQAVVEFSVACPLSCDQRPIIAELLDIAIYIGAVQHHTIAVPRELAHPDLLALLRSSDQARFGAEIIELDLASAAVPEAILPGCRASGFTSL